jgi:hypothetical protein
MAITDTPVKIRDAYGNIQRYTASEEQSLAYRLGLHLSTRNDSDITSLTMSLDSATAIGTFTDTFYNEPVGTHPGALLSTGTTTTTLYQKGGAPLLLDSENRIPIAYIDNFGIQEMMDSDLDNLTTRLLGIAMSNEYPGSFRMSTSLPSLDYDVHIPAAFTDTRTDGTSIDINIYQRKSFSALPAEVNNLHIKRTLVDSGEFQGLQESTDLQIKATFGIRARNLIAATVNSVGWHQLRSSADGPPVAPGTWVARGVATDTRNTTADENFAGSYLGDYAGEFAQFYGGLVDKSFAGSYAGIASYVSTEPTTLPTIIPTVLPTSYAGTRDEITPGVQPTTIAGADPTAFYTTDPTSTPGPYQPSSFVITRGTWFYTGDTMFYGPTPTTFFQADQTFFFLGAQPTAYFTSDPTSFFTTDPTTFVVSTPTITFGVLPTAEPTVALTTIPTSYVSPLDYLMDYVGQYQGSVEVQYVRLYSKAYLKDYAGETVNTGNTAIETYTLYVRTA